MISSAHATSPPNASDSPPITPESELDRELDRISADQLLARAHKFRLELEHACRRQLGLGLGREFDTFWGGGSDLEIEIGLGLNRDFELDLELVRDLVDHNAQRNGVIKMSNIAQRRLQLTKEIEGGNFQTAISILVALRDDAATRLVERRQY